MNNSHDLTDVAGIIAAFGGADRMAKTIVEHDPRGRRLLPQTITAWKGRRRIPGDWFLPIIRAARQLDIELSYERLWYASYAPDALVAPVTRKEPDAVQAA